MAAKQDFIPLVRPTAEKPKSQYIKASTPIFGRFSTQELVYLRDQLSISTWLALGATVQAVLVAVVGRLAVIPALALILYRVSDAFLIAAGVKHNHYMDGVIMNKFSSQYPDALGQFGAKPANDDIVVFLIGARINHPMGMFAYGAERLGDDFGNMVKYLDDHAEEFDFLGASGWTGAERVAGNELLTLMYFKSTEGLHKFAHHDLHRQTWNWWNKEVSKMPHISIWHEVYRSPKGNWENIYINSHPDLIGATSFKINHPDAKAEGIEPGKPFYVSPIVDARRGLLKTSAGRMSQSNATEHDIYNDDPYAQYGKLGYVQ